LNGFSIDGKDLVIKKAQGMEVPPTPKEEEEENGLSDYDRLRKQIVQKETQEREEREKIDQEKERQRQFEILK